MIKNVAAPRMETAARVAVRIRPTFLPLEFCVVGLFAERESEEVPSVVEVVLSEVKTSSDETDRSEELVL